MNWLILALVAPAIYTVVNYIDKFVIESKVKDYRGMPIYGAITGLCVGTLFWLILGRPILDLTDAILIITSGAISMFAYYFYFSALSKSQTSLVIIFFQMTPIFTLILALIFLKEAISLKQLLGFILIIVSCIALSLEGKIKKFKLTSSFYLILLADILISIASILVKLTISANSFSKIFPYESWGLALGGAILYLLFVNVRTAFRESFTSVGKRVLLIMFLNEWIFVIAKAISFLAIALGPVALISVLGATQAFYGILFGAILAFLNPFVFKDEGMKHQIVKKIIASIVLFIGIALIY
jgi:uncharacterized membrane protein